MNVLVLGASGNTGRKVVAQALDAGHKVTAFVRNPAKFSKSHASLTVFPGDVFSLDSIAAALKGQDVVISTLGSNSGKTRLITSSTRALISAANAVGVNRIIMMSSLLVSPDFKPSIIIRTLLNLFMKPILEDRTTAEQELRESNLDWTIVYATILTNSPKTGQETAIRQGQKIKLNMKIARADVADYLLKQIQNPSSIRTSPTITSGHR